jgi:hypothetical protein
MKTWLATAVVAAGLVMAPGSEAQDLVKLKCPYGANDLGRPGHAVAGLVTVNLAARSMKVEHVDAGDNVVESSGDRAARISDESISINVGGEQGADYVLNRYSATLTAAVYSGTPSKLRVTWNCERYQRGSRQF